MMKTRLARKGERGFVAISGVKLIEDGLGI
jgi:hypothetical protein